MRDLDALERGKVNRTAARMIRDLEILMRCAQGGAMPLLIWPGVSAQELAADFDLLLDRIVRTGRIPVSEKGPQA